MQRITVQNFHFHIFSQHLNDPLRGEAHIDETGNIGGVPDILVQLLQGFLTAVGQRLDEPAPCRLHVARFIHQYAQAYRRRSLFGSVQISCQVVGDFTVHQFRRSGKRFRAGCVTCHGNGSVANRAANIQMTILRRQIYIRVAHIPPGNASLGFSRDALNGPVAGHFDANAFLVFHGGRQQQRSGYGTSQCGSSQVGQIMAQGQLAHQTGGSSHINARVPHRRPGQDISFAGKLCFCSFILINFFFSLVQ